MVLRDCKCIEGGGHFISRPPQNTRAVPCPQSTEREVCCCTCCLRVQYEKVASNFWCVIGVWHEAMRRTYMHDYGTCPSRAPVPVRAVDARFFAVEALGRKATGSRESAQTARRSHLETRPAVSAVPWN